MTTSSHVAVRDLAGALRRQSVQAGETTPSVHGSDWRRAVVAAVGTDGTVTTTDGITALRAEAYQAPAAGDVIRISVSSAGSAVAEGRLASSTEPTGAWTALTPAAGITPGQGSLDVAQFRIITAWGQLRVELRGAFTATTALVSTTTVTTMPTAARPPGPRTFAVARNYSADTKGTTRVEVMSSGALQVYASVAPNSVSWLCLDGCHYEL